MFWPVAGHVWLRPAPLGQIRPAGFELTGGLEACGQPSQIITLNTARLMTPKPCGLCKRFVYQQPNAEARDEERTFTCGHSLHVVCLAELGASWVERGRPWDSEDRAAGVCPICHPGSAGHEEGKCKCCTNWKVTRKALAGGKCPKLATGNCELHCHLKHDRTKPQRARKERRILQKCVQQQEQQIEASRRKLDEAKEGTTNREERKAKLGDGMSVEKSDGNGIASEEVLGYRRNHDSSEAHGNSGLESSPKPQAIETTSGTITLQESPKEDPTREALDLDTLRNSSPVHQERKVIEPAEPLQGSVYPQSEVSTSIPPPLRVDLSHLPTSTEAATQTETSYAKPSLLRETREVGTQTMSDVHVLELLRQST